MSSSKSPLDQQTHTLLQLLKLINSPRASSQDIINYLQARQLPAGIYLPISKNIMAPLVFFCCRRPNMKGLLRYIIAFYKKHSTDLSNISMCYTDDDLPKSEPLIDLLYYSRPEYIPSLIKYGARLSSDNLIVNCRKLLTGGMVDKLLLYYQAKLISKQQLIEITKPAEQLTKQIIKRIAPALHDDDLVSAYIKSLHIIWSSQKPRKPSDDLLTEAQKLGLTKLTETLSKYCNHSGKQN